MTKPSSGASLGGAASCVVAVLAAFLTPHGKAPAATAVGRGRPKSGRR